MDICYDLYMNIFELSACYISSSVTIWLNVCGCLFVVQWQRTVACEKDMDFFRCPCDHIIYQDYLFLDLLLEVGEKLMVGYLDGTSQELDEHFGYTLYCHKNMQKNLSPCTNRPWLMLRCFFLWNLMLRCWWRGERPKGYEADIAGME